MSGDYDGTDREEFEDLLEKFGLFQDEGTLQRPPESPEWLFTRRSTVPKTDQWKNKEKRRFVRKQSKASRKVRHTHTLEREKGGAGAGPPTASFDLDSCESRCGKVARRRCWAVGRSKSARYEYTRAPKGFSSRNHLFTAFQISDSWKLETLLCLEHEALNRDEGFECVCRRLVSLESFLQWPEFPETVESRDESREVRLLRRVEQHLAFRLRHSHSFATLAPHVGMLDLRDRLFATFDCDGFPFRVLSKV